MDSVLFIVISKQAKCQTEIDTYTSFRVLQLADFNSKTREIIFTSKSRFQVHSPNGFAFDLIRSFGFSFCAGSEGRICNLHSRSAKCIIEKSSCSAKAKQFNYLLLFMTGCLLSNSAFCLVELHTHTHTLMLMLAITLNEYFKIKSQNNIYIFLLTMSSYRSFTSHSNFCVEVHSIASLSLTRPKATTDATRNGPTAFSFLFFCFCCFAGFCANMVYQFDGHTLKLWRSNENILFFSQFPLSNVVTRFRWGINFRFYTLLSNKERENRLKFLNLVCHKTEN